MKDLETIAKEEKFNPFAKKDYKISKYEVFKENAKNFLLKPVYYINNKIGKALKNIFMPYL